MSLKAKLVTSISAFALVLALLIVGVFAVNSATINMGGSISFQATDVHAKVEITVTGTSESTQPSKTYLFTYNSEEQGNGAEVVTGGSASWDTNSWTFGAGREIVVTVKITNLDASREIDVTFVAPEDQTSDKALGANLTCVSTGEDSATIVKSGTATYTMTFTITDENQSLNSANWDATLTLADGGVGA